MAFPQVAAHIGQTFDPAATTHNVTMPSTVNAGDLLIVLLVWSNTNSISNPSGWSNLFQTSFSGRRGGGWLKVAAGTEGSTNVNFSTSSSSKMAARVYRVTGWFGDAAGVEATGAATGSGSTPNPASLTPSWGAAETLWLANAHAWTDATSVTSYPSNYSNGAFSIVNSENAIIASARRELSASSEDPATFTLNDSGNWLASTIAIQPAGGTAPSGGRQTLGRGIQRGVMRGAR